MDNVCQWAESQGWEPVSADVRARVEVQVRRMSFQSGEFTRCWSRKEGDVLWVVGEAELTTRGSRDSFVRYALIFAESETESLPAFRLRPTASGHQGMVANLLSVERASFSDDPKFRARYDVSTDRLEFVRMCLDTDLCQQLLETTIDFNAVARPRHFLVHAEAGDLSLEDWQTLLAAAQSLFTGIANNFARFQDMADDVPSREERLKMADEAGGIGGTLLRRYLENSCFDRRELNEFLSQSTPRDVPAQIAGVFQGDRFLLWFTLIFGCCGLGAAAVTGMLLDDQPIHILVPVGCGALGCLFLGIFVWLRKRAGRRYEMLRTGVIVNATIEKVDETNFMNGNELVYAAVLRLSDSGRQVKVRAQGRAAGRLLDLSGSRKEIQLLQDQLHPDRVLAIDAYVM